MEDIKFSKGDRLRIAIGEVVITFQIIENVIAEFICRLLNMNEQKDVQRISSSMSFKQKVDLVCDLYPTRRKSNWPEVDIKAVKNALSAAEEFRNSIVHSFWYVSGNKKIVWMRSKGSLRSLAGLTYVDGVADIGAMEKGIASMLKIGHWYFGETNELKAATTKIKTLTKKLTRRVSA